MVSLMISFVAIVLIAMVPWMQWSNRYSYNITTYSLALYSIFPPLCWNHILRVRWCSGHQGGKASTIYVIRILLVIYLCIAWSGWLGLLQRRQTESIFIICCAYWLFVPLSLTAYLFVMRRINNHSKRHAKHPLKRGVKSGTSGKAEGL